MSFNSTQIIHELRADFEQLIELVTGPESQTATLNQMEQSLFRRVLRLGFKFLQLFLATRTQAEGCKAKKLGHVGHKLAVRIEAQKCSHTPAAHWQRACNMISACSTSQNLPAPLIRRFTTCRSKLSTAPLPMGSFKVAT